MYKFAKIMYSMKIKMIYLSLLLIIYNYSNAQNDSSRYLKPILIKGYKVLNGVGHMLEVKDGIIFSGKKNEVIIVDSLDANKSINSTRQILGRIPGLNISETESSGFTSNGIATRGLNPSQSVEMNTRQNGYNISADIYGYNEAYYIPPMEAVSRIEFVRGAASLQFGPQFGGLVNYITKDGPLNKKAEYNSSFTIGSYGLFNSFNSLGGTYKKWNYYSFLQFRSLEGYLPNSRQNQYSAFLKIQYNPSSYVKIGLEYSMLRNKIQMPGGLTDSMFLVNPRFSNRTRNWIKSPWNIISTYLNYNPSENTTFSLKTTFLFSNRSLVWFDNENHPYVPDLIDPNSGQFAPRDVESEDMNNISSELRLSHNYKLGTIKSTFSGGIRISQGWFKRESDGEGTSGSDFDLQVNDEWGSEFDFETTNIAPFIENIFKLGKKINVTPGVRFELLKNKIDGFKMDDINIVSRNEIRKRNILLVGLGIDYKITQFISNYANISSAYRPIDYGSLEPFGVTSKIDPNLKDAKGYNADFGFRGTIRNILNFDFSGFYLVYNNRIGLVLKKDLFGGNYIFRTNAANSIHKGWESYVELNLLKFLRPGSKQNINIFNSFAYVDARYTSGIFKGNRVEAAVKNINRVGLNYSDKRISCTFQYNHTGDAFGDATNLRTSSDPVAGYIPAYDVLDFSTTLKFDDYIISGGINNISNKAYFTRRTDEYPGPGIIPAVGRSVYLGLSIKL